MRLTGPALSTTAGPAVADRCAWLNPVHTCGPSAGQDVLLDSKSPNAARMDAAGGAMSVMRPTIGSAPTAGNRQISAQQRSATDLLDLVLRQRGAHRDGAYTSLRLSPLGRHIVHHPHEWWHSFQQHHLSNEGRQRVSAAVEAKLTRPTSPPPRRGQPR